MPEQVDLCLITPSHLCSAPRVVKEADALVAAGYSVTVVSTRNSAVADKLDEAILQKARWKHRRVDLLSGNRPLRVALQRVARWAVASANARAASLAALAENEAFSPLAREAVRTPARMYIGHCLTGLSAALHSGSRRRALIGFDAEDYHEAELLPGQMGTAGARAASILQAAAWPRLCHLSAAAPLIAKKLGEDYGKEPGVLLNVFPKSMAPSHAPAERPIRNRPRLYWFSQTIGPGRGLDEVVDACLLLDFPVDLHLRGHDEGGFSGRLRDRMQSGQHGHNVVIETLALPDEMARLAAEYDIGLCLEQTVPLNRGICLTNKIFTYLLAGIPMVLSATPAHRELAPRLGAAAIVADTSDPRALANAITRLARDSGTWRAAAQWSWDLGQTRYNWDIEQASLVSRVHAVLGPLEKKPSRP
jgi:hypothetical protein